MGKPCWTSFSPHHGWGWSHKVYQLLSPSEPLPASSQAIRTAGQSRTQRRSAQLQGP